MADEPHVIVALATCLLETPTSIESRSKALCVSSAFPGRVEFAKAVFEVALAYPEAETIHLVMDNLSTHSRKSLTDLCGEEFGGEI